MSDQPSHRPLHSQPRHRLPAGDPAPAACRPRRRMPARRPTPSARLGGRWSAGAPAWRHTSSTVCCSSSAHPYVIGIILFIAGAPRSGAYDSTSSDYAPVKAANPGLIIAGGVLLLAGLVLMLGIQIWNRAFRQGRTGQSIGKKTMGLKLVDERTGQPIGAGMSFVRDLAHVLDQMALRRLPLAALGRQAADVRRQDPRHRRRRGAQGLTPAQAGESQVQPGTLRSTQNASTMTRQPIEDTQGAAQVRGWPRHSRRVHSTKATSRPRWPPP